MNVLQGIVLIHKTIDIAGSSGNATALCGILLLQLGAIGIIHQSYSTLTGYADLFRLVQVIVAYSMCTSYVGQLFHTLVQVYYYIAIGIVYIVIGSAISTIFKIALPAVV